MPRPRESKKVTLTTTAQELVGGNGVRRVAMRVLGSTDALAGNSASQATDVVSGQYHEAVPAADDGLYAKTASGTTEVEVAWDLDEGRRVKTFWKRYVFADTPVTIPGGAKRVMIYVQANTVTVNGAQMDAGLAITEPPEGFETPEYTITLDATGVCLVVEDRESLI